ncbi:MAG TPA: hypothetical protein VF278_02310, partial [Pirellulales bacterium]
LSALAAAKAKRKRIMVCLSGGVLQLPVYSATKNLQPFGHLAGIGHNNPALLKSHPGTVE